ncbi:MAG: HEPN domain-containing protein [Acidimicrobiales bacterium]
MIGPSPEELAEADHWLREAGEELAVADLIASDEALPGRVACFHAHLAAEKALKSLQIRRGVVVHKVHNLAALADELPQGDQQSFDDADLDMVNPWTIDGRYPADHEEVDRETVRRVLGAAARVFAEVCRAAE